MTVTYEEVEETRRLRDIQNTGFIHLGSTNECI